MKKFFRIFVIVIICIFPVAIYAEQKNFGFTLGVTVVAIIIFSPLIALPFRDQLTALWDRSIQRANERREASWERDPSLRAKYYTLNCYLEAGLPLAKDTVCGVNLDGDMVNIQSAGMSFSVNYSQITDIQVQTKTEVQHFLVSSAGGALLGNEMFGSIGAAIGGRIQHQTIEEDTCYLLIAYLSETGPQYLLFQFIVSDDQWRIKKIIEEQRGKMSAGTVHIEL